jgi:hypothetical protein
MAQASPDLCLCYPCLFRVCHVVHRRASFPQVTWCGLASLGSRDKTRHAVNYCSLPVTVLVKHCGD